MSNFEPDCFADEIAIDFPSVGALTARVREAFLSESSRERTPTLKTEVSLSSNEAHRGAIVPIDVLLRATCSSCGGRGEVWDEECPDCSGSGNAVLPRRLRVIVPPRVTDGSRLHFRVRAPQEASVHVELTVAVT